MNQLDIDFDNYLRTLEEEPWIIEEQVIEEEKSKRKENRSKKLYNNKTRHHPKSKVRSNNVRLRR